MRHMGYDRNELDIQQFDTNQLVRHDQLWLGHPMLETFELLIVGLWNTKLAGLQESMGAS